MNVAAAFDRASDYDRHAVIQAVIAERLADQIAAARLPPIPNILEFGCGTGLLGAELIDRLEGARWLMTDISPAMVARTAARFADRAEVEIQVMDGEHPHDNRSFDLICSSLAAQWFVDLAGAVERLRARLAPDGLLIFTTLAQGSFAEWRVAHGSHRSGVRDYPDRAALEALGLTVSIERFPVRHSDAATFLRSLKAIGAGSPRPGHRPLAPAILREAMTRFNAAGAVATYVVATCQSRKERS